MKYTILLFALIPFFWGCSDNENQDKDDLKERKEKVITELIKKTDAILLDKSINNYSFTFYEKFVVQNKTLAFKGDISDISIVDSSMFIDATAYIDNKMYFAKIKVSKSLNDKVKQVLKYDSYEQQRGVFIIKILKVISKNIGFNEEQIERSDDDPATYISFQEFNKKIIILKAELIDFVLE